MPARRSLLVSALAAVTALGTACGRERAPERAAAPAAARPDRLDPLIDSLLGAFRAGLPAPDSLADGATSRDSLGAAFVRAVAARDTQALRRLHVTRAEFAYLYFPTARIALPPYGIDAGLLWMQMTGTGERDLRRAIAAVPPATRFVGLACPEPPRVEGENRLHEHCLAIVRREPARVDTLSLFGSILERGGRFKLLSFVNKL